MKGLKLVIVAILAISALLSLVACTASTTALPESSTVPATTMSDEELAETVSKAYNTVFGTAPRDTTEWLTAKQTQKLLDTIAPSGVVAAGYHNQNRNTQQMIDLVAAAKSGGSGEAVVCWNFREDSLMVSQFVVDAGKVTLSDQWLTPTSKTFESSGNPQSLGFFEIVDGYLIYAESEEELDDNYTGRGFRVEPLSDELVALSIQYLDTVWTGTSWLRTEWSPTDISKINWDYFYESLLVGRTSQHYADLPGMPEASATPYALPSADVEAALTAAFPVTVEQLRAILEYRSSDQTYQFMGFRGGGYYSNQEVTAVQKGADGSLTMTISSSAVDFGQGAEPYCELTLLPDGKGGCKYLSNKIIYTPKPNKHLQDLSDPNTLYQKYVEVPLAAAICAEDWTYPTQIATDKLVMAYHFEQLRQNKAVEGAPGYPAEVVEVWCKEHFRTEQETLRQSASYDIKTNAYLCSGVGAAPNAQVTGARQNNNYLYLDYQVLSRADERTTSGGGLLSLVLVGNTWRYNYNTQWEPTMEHIGKPVAEILDNYDALNNQYVAPLVSGGFIHKAWTNATEILSGNLVIFFASHHPELYTNTIFNTELGDPYVDAAQLESFVRFYFDIPSASIRQNNDYYDAESHRYWLPSLGGQTNSKVTAAVLNGDLLTLTVAIDQGLEPIGAGTLVIREKPEGGYEYISLIVDKPMTATVAR